MPKRQKRLEPAVESDLLLETSDDSMNQGESGEASTNAGVLYQKVQCFPKTHNSENKLVDYGRPGVRGELTAT